MAHTGRPRKAASWSAGPTPAGVSRAGSEQDLAATTAVGVSDRPPRLAEQSAIQIPEAETAIEQHEPLGYPSIKQSHTSSTRL
jgi:hypothetical protein